jgi:allophanate hydrolase
MKTIDIPNQLTMGWLQEKYGNGEITPAQLISKIIERAKEDADFNIWITPPSLDFIRPYLDRLQSMDRMSTPLWGIPFAIKDNIDLKGVPTTGACADYGYTPDEDATVIKRLIDAGAIPVGKTNLDQFATGLVGTRSPYGETKNALNKDLISGGSSSGSAVAVARGQAVFSLGTDTAGSGRVPAALHNLVGYKSSLGAWSTKGVIPACASLDCVTVFAHSLDEAMEVDSTARGYDEQNPWSRDIPKPIRALPTKIVLPKESPGFYGPYEEEYRKAWHAAVAKLESLPLDIEYIDAQLFSEASAILYDGPFIAERWAELGEFITANPGTTFPVTEKVLRSGAAEKYTAASVFQAMHRLQAIKLEANKILKNAVLVMPTAGGTWTRDQVRQNPIGANSDMGRYTNHCNLLDLCAAAIPAGEAAEKVPFGITLFSTADSEGLICGLADLFLNNKEPVQEKEQTSTTFVAVCGLHMRGFPLEKQMQQCGARFIREDKTAEKYKMVKLPGEPSKPGLIKKSAGGGSVQVEIWEMPIDGFGAFTTMIPAPLGIGKLELADGSVVPGFICEGYVEQEAEDITTSGGWRFLEMEQVK